MRLTLTNQGYAPVPVAAADGGGWVRSAEPNTDLRINEPTYVIVIGEKPEFLKDIGHALEAFTGLVTTWKARSREVSGDVVLAMLIQNDGDKPVKVILGDPNHDRTVNPNDRFSASANLYMEILDGG